MEDETDVMVAASAKRLFEELRPSKEPDRRENVPRFGQG
jgi:hypothetical protein